MLRRRLSVRHKEADDGEENWLISYADLMTLLWGFFVILSAFSTPNQKMVEKLKESTSKAMGGEYERPFNELTNKLEDVLANLNLKSESSVEAVSDGVLLTFKSTDFFRSGSSSLQPEATAVISKIGNVLTNESTSFNIIVEGHTDDVPIKSYTTPSNWELSSDRAATVVRLFEDIGIIKTRLRPVGFADIQPVVDVKDLKGEALKMARSKNRRVVIRLQKILPKRMKENS